MDEQRWKDFLTMSVGERNLVVNLSSSLRKELKQHFTLGELGFRGSWDNIDLKALLTLHEERVLKILSQKRIKSRSNLLRDLKRLYSIMGSDTSLPEGESTLDAWLEH